MKEIANYMNGNVHTILYDNGTRILESEDDEFRFDFPTNIDVTITKRCNGHCPWCYLGCDDFGKHAELLNWEFLKTLHAGTEMAINLNDLTHPQLDNFLYDMKSKGIIVNGTINQKHFESRYDKIKYFTEHKLLNGIGVSLSNPTDDFIALVQQTPNAIIHVVNGLLTRDEYVRIANKGLKILILGYKNIRKGKTFLEQYNAEIQENMDFLYCILPTIFKEFAVISFDNLAVEQLKVKDLVSPEDWESYYQGDDGTSTFAIDLVNGVFGRNSMVSEDELLPIKNSIKDMFDAVRKERK